jgi:hypothetical protein
VEAHHEHGPTGLVTREEAREEAEEAPHRRAQRIRGRFGVGDPSATSMYPRTVHRRLLVPALCVLTLGPTAPAAAAATRLPGVRTPSGNIRCLSLSGSGRELLCTIDHAGYTERLQQRCLAPGGAGVDWHGFTLGFMGKGHVNCSGGILYSPSTQDPTYVTLDYGRTWRAGPFTCASARIGLTCRNGRGHGLFLSRASWRAW